VWLCRASLRVPPVQYSSPRDYLSRTFTTKVVYRRSEVYPTRSLLVHRLLKQLRHISFAIIGGPVRTINGRFIHVYFSSTIGHVLR
jgi:hypothetical protein